METERSSKRIIRSINWGMSETSTLFRLLRERPGVICSSKVPGLGVGRLFKLKNWREIAREMQIQHPMTSRSHLECQFRWKNLLRRAKKEMIDHNHQQELAAAGQARLPGPVSKLSQQVLALSREADELVQSQSQVNSWNGAAPSQTSVGAGQRWNGFALASTSNATPGVSMVRNSMVGQTRRFYPQSARNADRSGGLKQIRPSFGAGTSGEWRGFGDRAGVASGSVPTSTVRRNPGTVPSAQNPFRRLSEGAVTVSNVAVTFSSSGEASAVQQRTFPSQNGVALPSPRSSAQRLSSVGTLAPNAIPSKASVCAVGKSRMVTVGESVSSVDLSGACSNSSLPTVRKDSDAILHVPSGQPENSASGTSSNHTSSAVVLWNSSVNGCSSTPQNRGEASLCVSSRVAQVGAPRLAEPVIDLTSEECNGSEDLRPSVHINKDPQKIEENGSFFVELNDSADRGESVASQMEVCTGGVWNNETSAHRTGRDVETVASCSSVSPSSSGTAEVKVFVGCPGSSSSRESPCSPGFSGSWNSVTDFGMSQTSTAPKEELTIADADGGVITIKREPAEEVDAEPEREDNTSGSPIQNNVFHNEMLVQTSEDAELSIPMMHQAAEMSRMSAAAWGSHPGGGGGEERRDLEFANLRLQNECWQMMKTNLLLQQRILKRTLGEDHG